MTVCLKHKTKRLVGTDKLLFMWKSLFNVSFISNRCWKKYWNQIYINRNV